jgi:hypothetical protein
MWSIGIFVNKEKTSFLICFYYICLLDAIFHTNCSLSKM